MFHKRIHIFTGHFGSGKTEVAVNYAIKMAELYNKTAILDFDIVNPYFRTADVKTLLENANIKVITPIYAGTNVDVPAIPPEINILFENKEYKAVFDVGGDDIGARALSRYREEFLNDDCEMYLVINIKRPTTNTVGKIEEMINSIEHSSRLKVTQLVNNTNLLNDTKGEDIVDGQKLIEEVSKKLNIPLGFTSGLEDKLAEVKGKIHSDLLVLKKLIKLPWQ